MTSRHLVLARAWPELALLRHLSLIFSLKLGIDLRALAGFIAMHPCLHERRQ